jgi:hypothetical protein
MPSRTGSVLGVGFGGQLRGAPRRRTASGVNNNRPCRVEGQSLGEALGSFVSDLLPFLAHSHFFRRSIYAPTNPILLELVNQLLIAIAFLLFLKYFCLAMRFASKFLGVGDRELEIDIGIFEGDNCNQGFDVVRYEFVTVEGLVTLEQPNQVKITQKSVDFQYSCHFPVILGFHP